MGRTSTKKAKKKGPKGKKAREKAKVDRRWGEKAELEPAPLRMGKSRLVSASLDIESQKDTTLHQPADDAIFDEASGEVATDDEDMEVEKDLEPNEAYSALLSSIQKDRPTLKSNNDMTDDDGDDADSVVSEDSDTPDGSLSVPDADMFSKRFSRQPLSDDELKRLATPSSWEKTSRQSWEVQCTAGHDLEPYLQGSHKQRAKMLLDQTAMGKDRGDANQLQTSLGAASFNAVSLYADVSIITDRRQQRTDVHTGVVSHIMRHLRAYRSLIAQTQQRMEADDDDDAVDDQEWKRDQGFTRPSVLILLPTRSCAYEFVQSLVAGAKQTEKWERFAEEYGPPIDAENDEEGDDGDNSHRKRVIQQKSNDWKELFDDEKNTDDDFKVGIQWNMKKNRFRMFQDFLRSDIIVASPLGMKQLDSFDFLSSVEICFLGRADVLLQQNWDHVDDCLALLNQQPKETNDTDFSRVRQYYLSGQSSHWRQLVLESAIMDPAIQSTFRKTSDSLAGQVKIRRRPLLPTPILSSVTQTCVRVSCKSFADQCKHRVNYFMEKVFPQLEDQTLVYIQSYFDFVALRNCFIRDDFSNYVSVTEYSRHTEVARGRARFLQGRRKLLLYTGRAHFFLRHVIKGARHVVFLGVPAYPSFYADHVNRLPDQEKGDAASSCTLLFTQYEGHALERVMGSANANRMMKSKTSTFGLRAT